MRAYYLLVAGVLAAACTAEPVKITDDFGFDGTCVNCHAGLSAQHVHSNFKLRCIDCHGGNDQVKVAADAFKDPTKFKDGTVLAQAHVLPKQGLSRFFFANGVDDDGDGVIDNPTIVTDLGGGNFSIQPGESYEPQLHGEGPGEFVDDELQRDLNYTRFLNPGDLRIATIGCGSGNAAAGQGGSVGCHQQTIETVRRSIMVNQSAVTNGAYYGNESWRQAFIDQRGNTPDPRAGAFSYALDYSSADNCITKADPKDTTGRAQPHFDSKCAEDHAAAQDPAVAAGAPGNVGLPAFEMSEGTIEPVDGLADDQTIDAIGAGDTRYPWGGTVIADPEQTRVALAPLLNGEVLPGIPDPVDNILRTFRAYYPLNYPGSVVNQNFTFGQSIAPEIQRFVTANPYGRGHSSGCTACHAEYNYAGNREPTQVLQDDGTIASVVDPTTKHREFNPDTDDRGFIDGFADEQLIGRVVKGNDQVAAADQRNNNCGPGLACQQKTYSANHNLTTSVTTKQCGLCHGFVTRINYAYQGMAEEEQRDQLARRKSVDFTTPAGTKVRIFDSWVRMDNHVIVDTPELRAGLNIITLARKRDADLAAKGFVAGNGGCGQEIFSEDCNNNGELDHNLQLTKTNPDGSTETITIDEDLDKDGKLGLIDRLPREDSIDGRQVRYIYGGRNGSTRLMDVHFERGMHCIDCHFLQDVHGDGHVYSTNWDQIEVECEDCHGAKGQANLITSGPNGGNDLTKARDHNLQPFFEAKDGKIIQHSRVTPGLSWVVPQTPDAGAPGTLAGEAHSDAHIAAPGSGSSFAGEPGSSALTDAKLECATCHSSWVTNCVGCHVDINVGDPQRITVNADLVTGTKTPRENEIWLSNASNAGHINFQLLGLLRAPFVMGVSSTSEKGRLGTFRSSMQAHVSVTDGTGETLRDNLTFTTFQKIDGNSGRMNVATSGVAMNQTMAHTVRPKEARGCETCHPLVDKQQRIRNEHILGESMGIGSGVLPYVGDWGMVVGTGGIELYEHKAEKEIATNQAGKSQRFPGMVVNGTGVRTPGGVEPTLAAGVVANDAVFIRNFNPTPATVGGTQPPTLEDVVVLALSNNTLLMAKVSTRGRTGNVRPAQGDPATSFSVTLPAAPAAVAHIAQDVSDPFVYAASTAGVSAVKINNVPGTANAAQLLTTTPFGSAKTPTSAVLAGDELYVGTTAGTVETFSLANPGAPVFQSSTPVGSPVTSLAVGGFVLYAGTNGGLAALALDDPDHPTTVLGATNPIVITGFAAQGISTSAGHVYVAAGNAGVLDIDTRTVASPSNLGNLAAVLAPGQPVNAADVIVSKLPGQTWLLVADATGDMWGLKLDNHLAKQEKCFPNPTNCLLDMDFMDATVSGRDPSFDPVTGLFDAAAVDPSGPQFFHQVAAILTTGKRLIHPGQWEQIGTLTGRRLRDSFMNGSGVLSLPVMQDMRSVLICESTADSHAPGNLGQLGYADDAFFSSGNCVPFEDTTSAKPGSSHRRKRPAKPPTCKRGQDCMVGAQLGLDLAKHTQ